MKTSLLTLLFALSATGLHAQNFQTKPCTGSNGSGYNWFGENNGVCEIRSTVLPFHGPVRVADTNGSIEVVAEDRSDVALEAKVQARAEGQGSAESLLHQIRIVTDGEIHAEGPHDSGSGRGWSVSYKLRVPRHADVGAQTSNGSVSVAGVVGTVDATSVNGGLRLLDLNGTVKARTVNGVIEISLGGDHWRGSGINADAVNGAITLNAPADLSAHLVANTVNGSVAVSYPLNSGSGGRRHVDATLGQGGPTISLGTVNGSIAVHGDGGGRTQRQEE